MHTGSIGAEICEEVYILRSGMWKGIKRILIGVLVLVLLVLGEELYRLTTYLRFRIMSLRATKFRNRRGGTETRN